MRAITHGTSGYRRGCKCEVCRQAHAKAERDRRARRKSENRPDPGENVQERPELASTPAADTLKGIPVGPIETALDRELGALVGEPPWKDTLAAIAKMNARLLDNVLLLDRLDLASPLQLRMLEVLQRLRAAAGADASPAAGMEAMLRGLGQPG